MQASCHGTIAGLSTNHAESASASVSLLNALTFDIEEYFQVSGFERVIPRSRWTDFPSRVAPCTEKILEMLGEAGVRATFFVLGWVARRHPELVRAIDAAGHELGSHGFEHRLVYELSPQEFRADLGESLKVLEDITGKGVVCYRAASFSITPKSLFALEILAEEGIRYDASIYPIRHDRYGMPAAPLGPYRVQTTAGEIWEFPATAVSWWRFRLPVGGGGYLRLYPLFVTRWLLRQAHREGRPVLVYVHPWELDPQQPRVPGVPWPNRFRHYVNLHSTERKLRDLLGHFSWGSLSQAIAAWQTSAFYRQIEVPVQQLGGS